MFQNLKEGLTVLITQKNSIVVKGRIETINQNEKRPELNSVDLIRNISENEPSRKGRELIDCRIYLQNVLKIEKA